MPKTKQKKKRSRMLLSSNLLCHVLRKENTRLRWELNEQTAYADEYHASAHEQWLENQKLQKQLKEARMRKFAESKGLNTKATNQRLCDCAKANPPCRKAA